MPTTTLKYAQTVSASPAAVFRAFTNATALREWLAEVATVDPRIGGRFFLAWNSGYYAAGEYTKIQQDKEVQLIWAGRDDPAPTKVRLTINPLDNGMTSLTLEHSDLNNQAEWANTFREISRGWELGMRNLVSILEEGPDLRIVNRPMMGILFGDFEKKHAEELGVPVNAGMRISSVVDGLGAQQAGLKKNDVIVAVESKAIADFSTLVTILQSKQAGDKIEVFFYRGGEKKRIVMELSRRPIPEIPMTPASLSAGVAQKYAVSFDQLAGVLKGASDEAAAMKPKEGEWNAKEVLAHLIHNERDTQAWINDLVFSQERASDNYSGNLQARVQATARAYGSVDALMEELRRNQAETIALLADLPDSFTENKGSFWRMGYQLIEIGVHTSEHAAQINDLLAK
jgi:uncharacterized protein YndB with AHSA1/START domain